MPALPHSCLLCFNCVVGALEVCRHTNALHRAAKVELTQGGVRQTRFRYKNDGSGRFTHMEQMQPALGLHDWEGTNRTRFPHIRQPETADYTDAKQSLPRCLNAPFEPSGRQSSWLQGLPSYKDCRAPMATKAEDPKKKAGESYGE